MDEPIFMLTTSDNPWNPFTNFEEWNAFDEAKGYNTNSYLARIAIDSPELSPAQSQHAVNMAIDEIIEYNPTGNYVKVSPKDYDNWIPTK